MDRHAIAQAQRRRQAHEALEFERNRTTSLEEQIEEIVAEADGPMIDEEAFASMAPEDAEAVRAILQTGAELELDEEWLAFEGEQSEADANETGEDDSEEEIARLEAEITASRRRQEVLERYIEALGG